MESHQRMCLFLVYDLFRALVTRCLIDINIYISDARLSIQSTHQLLLWLPLSLRWFSMYFYGGVQVKSI